MDLENQGYENPLGFTSETAQLLKGLGCTNLMNFMKRNMCLEDLRYLTKEDLKILIDSADNFDYDSFAKLQKNLIKRYNNVKPSLDDIINIMKNQEIQMKLIELYLKYTYIQLSLNRQDYILDMNTNIRTSQAIMIASQSVLNEEKDLRLAILKFQSRKTNVHSRKIQYGLLIGGGIGVAALVYYYYY